MVAALTDGSIFMGETSATNISLKISADHKLLQALQVEYGPDPWTKSLSLALPSIEKLWMDFGSWMTA